MSIFGEIRHDLSRLRDIARVMGRHGFAPAMARIPLLSGITNDDKAAKPDVPAALRFAEMLEELGPTFVKVGQILSTRNDLLPRDFTDALSRLQDQVPPFPFKDAKAAVERELGGPLTQFFSAFDETPLASASMAQVHTARTHDGVDVVVKVLRPGIEEQVRADSAMMVVLAQLLELVVEEAEHYHVASLAEEFEKGLVAELNFTQEAENLRQFASFNRERAGIHVPFLVDALSTRGILTMERIYGQRITILGESDGATRKDVVERLVRAAYEHFFVDGMFHADPHPGNVLYTDDGKIAFIDFGLVGRVSRSTQDRLLLVLTALSLRDADALARLLVRVGEVESRVALADFRDAIARLLERYLGVAVGDVDTSRALSDLLDLSTKFGVRMPREFALLSKASVSIDGIVRSLHPGLNPSAMIRERTESLLLERFDPRSLKGGGLRAALQVGLLIADAPMQITQVLWDLERGNLRVELRSDTMEKLERDIRGLGMTIFGAAQAAALTLGGIFVLARYDFTMFGLPLLPIIAFLVAGALFGVAFTWFLTGGKLPKLSLTALIGRRRNRRSSTDHQKPKSPATRV